MEFFKNKWFMITTFIVLPCLSIPILCRFFNFIIFDYPFWVKCHLTGINQNRVNIGIGTYGDMYGGLNAFVSGLAFLGLLITIGIQIWIYYGQEESKKKEKLETASNKLIYLDFLVKQSLSELDIFKEAIDELTVLKKNPNFLYDVDSIEFNKINRIVNEIDQEVFFTAYYQKHNKTDLINLFESFGKLFKSLQLFIKKFKKQADNYNVDISNLKNAHDILVQKENEVLFRSANEIVSNPLLDWAIDKVNFNELRDIEKTGNSIEIYHKIKEIYDSYVASDVKLKVPEIDTYLEDCSEYFEKLESVRKAILELCDSQLTEVTEFEDKVKEVAILVPLPT